MKSKTIIVLLAIIWGLGSFSLVQALVPVEAPITRVTVYPDRAMITRSATLDLPVGDHTVVIENLPYRAVDASFRGSIRGANALMLGLNHFEVRHTEIPQKKAAELDEQIYKMEKYQRQGIIDRKEVFDQQKKMLLSIGFKSGQEMSEQMDKGGLEIDQWRQAFGFVGEALRALNDSLSAIQREIDDIDRQLSKLKADRQAIATSLSLETKTVEIDVRMVKSGNISLDLEYLIGGASWNPIYDARLNEDNEKIDFGCFGEVSQNTGEDWNNVDLILSTTRPTQGAGPGGLNLWILSLYERAKLEDKTYRLSQDILLAPVADVDELLERETGIEMDDYGSLFIRGGRAGETSYLVSEIMTSLYSTAFHVSRKVSVASGEKAVRAPIGNYSLDRTVEYICRPKNRQSVYRLATITNQDKAPLLPGKVAIFAGSDYLGEASIEGFVAPGGEFQLPFGADNGLEIKREITKNKTSTKGDKVRIDQTIEISVTCNGRTERTITVEESLPVSNDGRIKVDLQDFNPPSDKMEKPDEGKAVWTVEIKPGEKKTISYSYRIEYPAGMEIVGI